MALKGVVPYNHTIFIRNNTDIRGGSPYMTTIHDKINVIRRVTPLLASYFVHDCYYLNTNCPIRYPKMLEINDICDNWGPHWPPCCWNLSYFSFIVVYLCCSFSLLPCFSFILSFIHVVIRVVVLISGHISFTFICLVPYWLVISFIFTHLRLFLSLFSFSRMFYFLACRSCVSFFIWLLIL